MGTREFYDHIWALKRHLGHMTYMLDSDWLKNPLLRSDWLGPEVAIYTTDELQIKRRWLNAGSRFCLLEHQNPSKTSEKMGYFVRVTVSLHIPYTANQEIEGSQDRLTP